MRNFLRHIYYYVFFIEYRIVCKYCTFLEKNGDIFGDIECISSNRKYIFKYYYYFDNIWVREFNTNDLFFLDSKMTKFIISYKGVKTNHSIMATIRSKKLSKVK